MDRKTIEKVGDKFAETLKQWLTEDEFAAVKRTNLHRKDGSCASHDYCDANMAMDVAMGHFGFFYVQSDPNLHVDLWNAAWDYAKAKHLTATNFGGEMR